MSKAIFELKAKVRDDLGKGASRRLRRIQNQLPAILYGGKNEPLPIMLDHNKVIQALEHEAFYSHILTLAIDGKKHKAVLKDLQRHPFKKIILHMDFQRVTDNYVITMKVPLHFINEEQCIGAKAGGVITHHVKNINIKCKAKDLPEFIEVDITNLNVDQVLHASDITLKKGLEIPELLQDESHDIAIVSVHTPRKAIEEEKAEEETEEKDSDKPEEDKEKGKSKDNEAKSE